MDCDHPVDQLTAVSGGQTRGSAPTFVATCGACDARFSGSAGVAALLASISRDHMATWEAIRQLGGQRPPGAGTPATPAPAGECVHYMAWLSADSAGSGSRGFTGSVTIRCAGCRQHWPEMAGLGIYLERVKGDRIAMRTAIIALGGKL